ncbi:MAG: cytochrome c oxidase subunit 3 [Flavobacteriaceae bacterium]|nr:cytochrome c oxidase subunit 3 [Flavobacteriaceae bacterium]
MMTITDEKNFHTKEQRAKKMMLWFGIVSMAMMFAGLTSSYVVSKSRPDWLNDFTLPNAFIASTVVILLSSLTLYVASVLLAKNQTKQAAVLSLLTLLQGIAFIVLQFVGFSQVIDMGYFMTGAQSSVTTSFLYVITATHLAHIAGGVLSLMVVTYKLFTAQYSPEKRLGFDLAKTFWHFVDILWLYLFIFLYFFG